MSGRLEKETQFYEKMKVKLRGMPKILNEYCTSLRANRKTYTTVRVYIINVIHFANFVCDGNLTEDFYKYVTPGDVENYIISLETRETKDGPKRTGDNILQARWSSLNTFFEWLIQRWYVDKNPIKVVNRPKNNTEHKVTYLTKPEINRFFKAVDKNPDRVMSARDKTMFSLAIATGLRASALLNINKEDVDLENGIIKVIEKRQKVREIAIGENMVTMLKSWIEIRDDRFGSLSTTALFISRSHGRLTPDAANDAIKRYCEEAGIQKHITMHKFRATSACSLAKAGVPLKAIQKQLGHASSQTTLIYIDTFAEDSERAKSILDSYV